MLMVTQNSEGAALTCAPKLRQDKRQPAELFLIFTHRYSSLETAVSSLFPPICSKHTQETFGPEPRRAPGSNLQPECQEATCSVSGPNFGQKAPGPRVIFSRLVFHKRLLQTHLRGNKRLTFHSPLTAHILQRGRPLSHFPTTFWL